MKWTILCWVWRLEGPLFVGMPPAGSLNRCRLYVPAQAVHGAVTAELARRRGDELSRLPDYGKFGHEIGNRCRFTYLYPAEKSGDDFIAWTPEYHRNEDATNKQADPKKKENQSGLWWHYHNALKKPCSDREFRRRLLDSRPGTAIMPETDAVSEGTLRETECVNPWWRDSKTGAELTETLLLGYVFIANNYCRQKLENLQNLFVGGDTRYGLGRMQCVDCADVSEKSSVFGKSVSAIDTECFEIKSNILLGHSPVTPSHQMQGAQELLAGWNPDALKKGTLCWSPGSSRKGPVSWFIDNHGCWCIKP